MLIKLVAPLAVIFSVILLAGCGGHRTEFLPEAGSNTGFDATDGLSAGLPQLSQLPDPKREVSIVGPGFFEIPLFEMVARDGTAGAPGELTVGTGGLGWAIYGVFGFDGDNGPTSARITTSSVSGQYFVGFSDYVNNEWIYAGPFTDSAEVEIPNTDEHTSATAFTSSGGTCYFVIICSAGDSAAVTGVELGVHGGELGPLPPASIEGNGSASPFFLEWSNSVSYRDPDFAGYNVQRAPLLNGDYSALNSEPIQNPFFNDDTAVEDVQYRYRICSEDFSGNRSVWRTLVDGPVSGEKVNPKVLLDMPLGPLHGPVEITFDFADSFDPEGEGITAYTLNFGNGIPPVSGANTSYAVTLQPGCYNINAEVECAGPPVRTSENIYRLIVYPRWQPTPVVVREPVPPVSPTVRRVLHARGSLNTAAQRVTFAGIDVTSIGLNFYSAPVSNPSDMTVHRLPVYSYPGSASDMVEVGETTYYAYSSIDLIILTRFDGETATQEFLGVSPDSPAVAVAFDGSQIWVFYCDFDGLNTNLLCRPSGGGGDTMVVPATGAISGLDALYNPSSGMIDVVYGGALAGTTEWVRFDTGLGVVSDSANLDAGMAADDVDLELDPATGRPIVMYSHTLIHRFRELDEFSVWTPEVQVDNSVANYIPLDLIVDDGTRYAYFRTGPANQAVLYRDDGGAWSAVNTVAFAANSGYEVALVPQPGSADRGLVLDMDMNFDNHLAQLHDDGTDTDIWQVPHGDGQGFELHTAAGSDGLHAVWRSLGTTLTRHATSADGASWSDPGDIGAGLENIGLASNYAGEVYFSCYQFPNSELYYWTGAAFLLKVGFPSLSDHRPFFSSPDGLGTFWCAYDGGATTMHYVEADEPAYPDSPVVMTSTPIWDGVSNVIGLFSDYSLVLAEGADINAAVVGLWEPGSDEVEVIYDPLFDTAPLDFFGTPITDGRLFASTSYVSTLPFLPEQVYFCTRGYLINPVRYTVKPFEPPVEDEIIVGKDFSIYTAEDIFTDDIRVTASSVMGNSLTGIVLLASGDGARSFFAWSRYGDWEELPLPEGIEYMSMPQLLVGTDGRWHILYKNWLTDQVMCISTVAP